MIVAFAIIPLFDLAFQFAQARDMLLWRVGARSS
jgi:hypothetical protein